MHLKAFSAIIKGCLEYCVIYRRMTGGDAEFSKAGCCYIHKFTHFIRVNMSKNLSNDCQMAYLNAFECKFATTSAPIIIMTE